MDKGKKEKGVNIYPADFVLDFLRCTVDVEDPYLVAVIFTLLKKQEIATCLKVCRIKNKFVDENLGKQINTHALVNLELLYPQNDDEFKKSGLKGTFDKKMRGKCLLVTELQITMKDFSDIRVCFFLPFLNLE